jgi:hypothetical protein
MTDWLEEGQLVSRLRRQDLGLLRTTGVME